MPDPAAEVVKEIQAAGGEAIACANSVSTPEGGKAIVDAAIKKFGRIDILIHSAGFTRRGAVKDLTLADFDAVLDVHLKGAIHVAHLAFPLMCEAGYGRIVLTSSIGGLYGDRNIAPYSIAKAGLIGLSNVLALEGAAHGVHCNSFMPSAVTRLSEGRDTSQFPPMDPAQVAPAMAWLVHEDCTMNGEMLISVAGRVAKAFVAETPGVGEPVWTIERVAEQRNGIGNAAETLQFPVVPSGFYDHLQYSFAMARKASSN